MFGTTFAWLFLVLIGLLLTRVGLKNPNLEPPQRKSGFILGGVAVVFLLLVSFFAFSELEWSRVYDAPPIINGQEFEPEGGTWAIVKGTVPEESELSEEERGYVAYAIYDSSIHRTRRVHNTYGFEKMQLELEDGTLVNFRRFENIPANWNWRDDAEYRFVNRGDTLWVAGYFSYSGERKDKRVLASDVECLFRGNDSDYQDSYVLSFARYGGILNLIVSVLSLLSAIYFTGSLLRLRLSKPSVPTETD